MIFTLLAILPYFLTAQASVTPTPTPGTLAINQLDALGNTTDGTVYVSDAFTPTANELLVVACTVRGGSSTDPGAVTITDSASLAWTQIVDFAFVTTGSSRGRMAIYAARVSASPSSMTITSTYALTTLGCVQEIFEVLQSDVANGVAQCFVQSVRSAINSVGVAAPLTLSTAGSANNRSLNVTMHWINEDTVPASGWTEIGDAGHSNPNLRLEAAWQSSAFDTSPTATWATSTSFGSVAFELKAR